MNQLISAAVARLKAALSNSAQGSALVAHLATGAGAVARTLGAKARDVIDAADYIVTPGAADATDKAGVQAAIDAAAVNGGRVRVRAPIRTTWNLADLSVPVNVVIDDERYSGAGHTAIHASGADVEMRIHGTSTATGEGPTFVAVNNAAAGNRTVSFVARFGAGIGAAVNSILHFGVVDGGNWYPDLDWIGQGLDGFRSRFRVGAAGAVIINAAGVGKNINPAAAYTAGYALVVNTPVDGNAGGGAYAFGVRAGALEVPGEVQIINKKAVRFQDAAGANRFALIPDFPSDGQFTIYDHVAGAAFMTFTSGGVVSLGALGMQYTATGAGGVANRSVFLDSADGKLKFKDAGGAVNALY